MKPFSLLTTSILCAVLLTNFVSSAVVEGSQPKEWPADPAKHVVQIKREAADEKQAALIATAEGAQPAMEELLKAAEEGLPKAEKMWWHKVALGIRIPFAITGDAVTYYSDLVTGYGKQKLSRYLQPSSSLKYEAGVKFHKSFEIGGKTFEEVHVVSLNLTFSQNFAATSTEGMQFEKKRVVVIDAAGKVIHIAGDSATEAPIMAI